MNRKPPEIPPVQGEVIPPPEPFLKGRFSLYHTPGGGIHVAALFDGDDETRHTEIPAMVLKMGERMGSGNPLSMLMSLGRKT